MKLIKKGNGKLCNCVLKLLVWFIFGLLFCSDLVSKPDLRILLYRNLFERNILKILQTTINYISITHFDFIANDWGGGGKDALLMKIIRRCCTILSRIGYFNKLLTLFLDLKVNAIQRWTIMENFSDAVNSRFIHFQQNALYLYDSWLLPRQTDTNSILKLLLSWLNLFGIYPLEIYLIYGIILLESCLKSKKISLNLYESLSSFIA